MRECRCYQRHSSSLSLKGCLLVTVCLFRVQQHQCWGHAHDAPLQNEPAEGAQPRYISYYSDQNNLGSAGIKLLIKAELPLLKWLNVGNYLC